MSNLVQIKSANTNELSKLQKQFNNNILKINNLKSELAVVESEMEAVQVRISKDILPIERKMLDCHAEEVKLLDKQYASGLFKKRDAETLSEIIWQRSFQLIEQFGMADLKPIFERHNNGISFEDENKKTNETISESMKEVFGQMYGMEFEEDVDVSSAEKFQEYVNQKVADHTAAEEARRANRKKTAKQLEKEQRLQNEEKQLTKTSRQIYMELVKEFHPDREQDEIKKARKTELMQKITQAYEKDDLFELLRLRLELMGTDFEHTNDDQLKYYVKLLKQQASELQEMLYNLKNAGKSSYFSPSIYDRFCSDLRTTMEQKFKKEIGQIKRFLKQAQQDALKINDFEYVKMLVQEHRKQQKQAAKNGPDPISMFGL